MGGTNCVCLCSSVVIVLIFWNLLFVLSPLAITLKIHKFLEFESSCQISVAAMTHIKKCQNSKDIYHVNKK
jgi:hypothetical protein